MDKKYRIVEVDEVDGRVLGRIRAMRDIPRHGVRKGDLGGWIETEENLSSYGDAWVGGNAKVYGLASVYDNALVTENAVVRDNASVFGDAVVKGRAIVEESARVYDEAEVGGKACVTDKARLRHKCRVSGDALIAGWAQVDNEFGGGLHVLWCAGRSTFAEPRGRKAYTKVTIVETLRREIVVEHPDYMPRNDVTDAIQKRYNAGHIVLTADDFSDYELFSEKLTDEEGAAKAAVVIDEDVGQDQEEDF